MTQFLRRFSLLLLPLLVSVNTLSAQEGGGGGTDYNSLTSLSNNNNAMGSARSVMSTPKNVLGSNYLFKNWNNDAVITLDTGRKFSLKQNFNINAAQGTFESKTSEASVFSFDLSNIEHVIINEDRYIVALAPEVNRLSVFRELGSYNGKKILKGFRTERVLGHPDPLRGQVNDEIKIREIYYLDDNDILEKIKLKKSTIIDLFEDDSKSLKKYIKQERLNFKDEADFTKLFLYLNNS